MSYSRMLLESTYLNDDMYRMRFFESPNCECRKDRVNVEHFLMACETYKEARGKLAESVADICTKVLE